MSHDFAYRTRLFSTTEVSDETCGGQERDWSVRLIRKRRREPRLPEVIIDHPTLVTHPDQKRRQSRCPDQRKCVGHCAPASG